VVLRLAVLDGEGVELVVEVDGEVGGGALLVLGAFVA